MGSAERSSGRNVHSSSLFLMKRKAALGHALLKRNSAPLEVGRDIVIDLAGGRVVVGFKVRQQIVARVYDLNTSLHGCVDLLQALAL